MGLGHSHLAAPSPTLPTYTPMTPENRETQSFLGTKRMAEAGIQPQRLFTKSNPEPLSPTPRSGKWSQLTPGPSADPRKKGNILNKLMGRRPSVQSSGSSSSQQINNDREKGSEAEHVRQPRPPSSSKS